MKNESIYHGFRHSGEIISHTVWLYFRFTLSFRDVEEILSVACTIATAEWQPDGDSKE
jgi:transposase-like protein